MAQMSKAAREDAVILLHKTQAALEVFGRAVAPSDDERLGTLVIKAQRLLVEIENRTKNMVGGDAP